MKETLRYLFQQKFNRDEYRRVVLQNLLHAQQLLREPQFLEETNDGDRIYGLGYLHDADGKEIGLYYTDVVNGDVRRKRVGFRQMMKPYVKYGADAAIAVFADKEHWRLSYMCDLKGGETSAKRFSYVFGDPKGQYNTPSSRLANLGGKKIVLDDLKETFSVEALSKEFFKEYHEHYDCICDNIISHPHIDALTPLRIHDYVKKMMGRIVFLHFLQKKRWLDDDPEFLKNLFFMQPLDRKADFLEQVLEPLFFGIFNTESDQREKLFADEHWDKGLLKQWEKLPYLNGGLFERDEVDKLKIKLPASLFEDLFSFMASYNFTVDENDPDDAEVGVDPEMLGKIFESLLEDNKAKGAFYTPKEIVRYMCKESLIAYLATQIDKSQSEGKEKSDSSDCDKYIRAFVETHEMQPELEPYREALDTALREVKICDPAIGSGAFPMGLLNELWRCREAIEETSSRIELKKEIIENNIYGVDIEKGAIDIARLRFWLSIVVDANKPEPLPNFDYKFMQGNSLIESFEGFDLSRISDRLRGGQPTSRQLVIGLDSHLSRQNLQRFLREYFSVTDHKKKSSMRQAINEEVKTLIRESIGGTPTSLAKLEKMDCSANQDFFLWHTWFKDIFDNGGFDIVIANPPYVLVQNLGVPELVDIYKKSYSVASFKIDLYHLFLELGHTLLKEGGSLYFINPTNFLTNNYNQALRDFLLKKTSIREIVNIVDNVFEASVNTCIINFTKKINKDNILYYKTGNITDGRFSTITSSNNPQSDYLTFDFHIIQPLKNDEARLIIEKIKKQSKPLSIYASVNFGMQLRNRKIYTGDVIVNPNPSELTQYHKKCYTGKDISPYVVTYSDIYCYANKEAQCGGCWIEEVHSYKPKILVRQVGSTPICGIDLNGYNVLNSAFMIVTKTFDPYELLGQMNSHLVRYFWSYCFEDKRKTFPKIKGTYLEKIPIKKSENEDIATIVKEIIEKKQTNPVADISNLEKELNRQVYSLYNLTPEEIAIIEH